METPSKNSSGNLQNSKQGNPITQVCLTAARVIFFINEDTHKKEALCLFFNSLLNNSNTEFK